MRLTPSATGPSSDVPETATWALMLGGFGLTGSALRRKNAASLAELGVKGLDIEVWVGVAVAASMLVERTERGDQMFMAMAHRHARHALDLDRVELGLEHGQRPWWRGPRAEPEALVALSSEPAIGPTA